MEDHEPCWCFSQIKGSMDEDLVTDADLISTVEFNQDGTLLATGDKGGRVVIFRREAMTFPHSSSTSTNTTTEEHFDSSRDSDSDSDLFNSSLLRPKKSPFNVLNNANTNVTVSSDAKNERRHPFFTATEYNFYSTFQSHEPEFDYLKSLEIEEKINRIKWLQPRYPSYFLLTTNDKTIKLWKIMERDKKFEGFNVKDETGFIVRNPKKINNLVVPSIKPTELMVEASLKRIYANAHTYHINSISINSDQETFISADDLRINLWNFNYDNVSFNIVDLKPSNMEDLSEVITAAEFHPSECNLFVYATSKGLIRLCDMRDRALCDQHAKLFEDLGPPSTANSVATKSFFSEIIASVSDVRFASAVTNSNPSNNNLSRTPSASSSLTGSGPPSTPEFKFATRDYLTVKIWDTRYESRPWHTFNVLDQLRLKLCALYENDAIFDKFEVCWSGDNSSIVTGTYNNVFRVFDINTLTEQTFQAAVPDTNALKIPTYQYHTLGDVQTPGFALNTTADTSPLGSAGTTSLLRRNKMTVKSSFDTSYESRRQPLNYVYYKPLRPIQIVSGYTPSDEPKSNLSTTSSKKYFFSRSPTRGRPKSSDATTTTLGGSSNDPYTSRSDLSRQDSLDYHEGTAENMATESAGDGLGDAAGNLFDHQNRSSSGTDEEDVLSRDEGDASAAAAAPTGGVGLLFGRPKRSKLSPATTVAARKDQSSTPTGRFPVLPPRVLGVDSFDFSKKILHSSWHPQDPILAVATNNNLFVFQKL